MSELTSLIWRKLKVNHEWELIKQPLSNEETRNKCFGLKQHFMLPFMRWKQVNKSVAKSYKVSLQQEEEK